MRHDVSLTIDLSGDFYLFLDLTDMCGRPVLVSLVPGKQVKKKRLSNLVFCLFLFAPAQILSSTRATVVSSLVARPFVAAKPTYTCSSGGIAGHVKRR